MNDVVVLGGGPAGLATAVGLARLGRSVVVLESTGYDRPRAGETFGGEVRPLLDALGAGDDLAALAPVPFRGVRSAWGASTLIERPSIYHPFGDGWHVDRARFDQLLARCAGRAGVEVRAGAGTCAVGGAGGAWTVSPEAGAEVRARFLVDASGRGAPATAVHLPDRRWLRSDRLVALLGSLSAPARPVEPLLVLEAVEDGWWYSVPQPGGALLAALVTDADLLPARGRTALAAHFSARLAGSIHTAARGEGATLAAAPWIARCDSGYLEPDRGPAWRAVGDAAMACDPLAGDGVARALRAGLEAAPEIDRALDDPGSVPAATTRERFRAYLEARGANYDREARWPEAPFWARRRPAGWRAAPILLDPRHVLRWTGRLPERDQIAPVEALIPPHALRGLLDRLRQPTPAHQALAFLRAAAPVADHQLVVGVQMLVALSVVTAAS